MKSAQSSSDICSGFLLVILIVDETGFELELNSEMNVSEHKRHRDQNWQAQSAKKGHDQDHDLEQNHEYYLVS